MHQLAVPNPPRLSRKNWKNTLSEFFPQKTSQRALSEALVADVDTSQPLDLGPAILFSDQSPDYNPDDLLEEVSKISQLHELLTGSLSEKVSQQQFIVRRYFSEFQQHNRALSRIYASLLQPDLLEFQKQLQEGHVSLEFIFRNLQSQRVGLLAMNQLTPRNKSNS